MQIVDGMWALRRTSPPAPTKGSLTGEYPAAGVSFSTLVCWFLRVL